MTRLFHTVSVSSVKMSALLATDQHRPCQLPQTFPKCDAESIVMDTLSRMDGSLESTFERLAAAVYPELNVGPVFLDPTRN